jgi:redox-sensitive bicupin YhaK (pirin superfamily)
VNEVSGAVKDIFADPTCLDVRLGAGQIFDQPIPLNEPSVRHGPFVMNTEEEIVQAIHELRSGNLIRPWRGAAPTRKRGMTS